MLNGLTNRLFRQKPVSTCFCTLAIHEQYRRRARLLCADAPTIPWIVLTDEPDDFAALSVTVFRHHPVGPMATDFLTRLPATGNGRGRPAYHDKRFVLRAALEHFDTAIFIDADSRIQAPTKLPVVHPGIAVPPDLRTTISAHLNKYGPARRVAFAELACALTGNLDLLETANWCSESLFAITKDGRESQFFETWAYAAEFLQTRGVFTGEGGVIGIAAAMAGWKPNYRVLARLRSVIQHEGLGPKPLTATQSRIQRHC
ncbi:MAG: hypothetical protein ABR555_00420 [Pyrinomonadaceae bacterium]